MHFTNTIACQGAAPFHEPLDCLAWWYWQSAPGDRGLERLEAGARAARRGLWADANSVLPWEWRRVDRAGRLR